MPVLIIFNGESNSGGLAQNSLLTSADLTPKPKIQILNNNNFVWETLQIGVNNLIDHAQLAANASHGWELGLSNRADDLNTPVYLCKTGQGGSVIANWNTGGTYYTKFLQRINAAKSLLSGSGISYRAILWYTQGINDASQGADPNIWKAATIAHFAKIRVEFPNIPILFSHIPSQYSIFNTAISEIIAAGTNIYDISVDGAALGIDTNHWGYAGMQTIAGRMVDKTLQLYPKEIESPNKSIGRSKLLPQLVPNFFPQIFKQ